MGREVAFSRRIRILFTTTTNRHDLPRTFCWLRFSIRSTACESRLMSDALTIVGVHISRQHGQSLLHSFSEQNFLQIRGSAFLLCGLDGFYLFI